MKLIPYIFFFKFQAPSKQGKIYIGKFKDPTISKDVILEHFIQYGQVVDIQRPVDSKNNKPGNFCFVTFDKEEPANALIKKVNIVFTKVPILKEVTSEKCNSVELNTFTTSEDKYKCST